jgi:uncharacterized membrane protein YjgN (DUF898 family)
LDTTGLEEAGPQAATPAAPAAARRCRLRFTGTGKEYFGIWIVNLLLTIATLGIYSAWAKVRKMQYFYRNTRLDGSVFDYHGNPVAILKGRLLALAIVAVYQFALPLLGVFGLIPFLAVMAAVPWLLDQSYRFRLHNSSYRGLRLRFAAPLWQAYLIFGVPLLLLLMPAALIASGLGADPQQPRFGLAFMLLGAGYLALGLLWPYLHFSLKRWQHRHAFYGTAATDFLAGAGSFYGPYLVAAILMVGVVAVWAVIGAAFGSAAAGHARSHGWTGVAMAWALLSYVPLLSIAPFISARIQNTVWYGTRVGDVGFSSEVRAGRLIAITLSNLLMIVVTLGLLIPFAVMRLMKYKIESIEVLDADAMQRFESQAGEAPVGATGEGAMDVMDLDFGL